jgi:hypothetical protein
VQAFVHEKESKILLHQQLTNRGMQLVNFCRAHSFGAAPRRVKAVAMFSITAHFRVPIRAGYTPYFGKSPASVIFLRIALNPKRALNSGKWVLRFFSLDHVSRHTIHLND